MISARRIFKWSASIVAVILVITFTLLALLYSLLRSGDMTEHALPQIQPYLKPLGVEIAQLGSMKIDPFDAINIEDLTLRWHDAQQGSVNIKLGSADIVYDALALMDDQFTLRKLHLNDVHLQAELELPPAEMAPQTADSDEAAWSALEELLNSPPLALLIADNIEINNLSLDITLIQSPQRIHYRGTLKNFSMNARWQPDLLNGQLSFSLVHADDEQLLITETEPNRITSQIQLRPAIEADASWQFEQKNRQWQFSSDLSQDIRLTDLSIDQTSDGQHDQINADKLTLTLKHKSHGRLGETLTFDAALHSQLDLQNLVLISQLGDVRSEMQSEQLTLSLGSQHTGQLDQFIDAEFQLDMALSALQIDEQIGRTEQTQINLSPTVTLTGHGSAKQMDNQTWQFDVSVDGSSSIAALKLNQHLGDERLALSTEKLQLNLRSENRGVIDERLDFMFNLNGYSTPIAFEQNSVEEGRIDVSFSPHFDFDQRGKIGELKALVDDANLASMILQAKHQITLNDLTLTQTQRGQQQRYHIAQPSMTLDTQLQNKQISNNSQISLENIQVPEFNAPVSINATIDLSSDTDLRRADMVFHSLLNQESLADIELAILNLPEALTIKHTIQTQLPDSLPAEWRDHPDVQALLAQLGTPHVAMSGSAELQHHEATALDADFGQLLDWPINAQGKLKLIQHQAPLSPEGVTLAQPLMLNYQVDFEKLHHITLTLDAPSIQTPPLLTAMPLFLTLESQLNSSLTEVTANGQLRIDGQHALAYDIAISDRPKQFTLQSEFTALANPDWAIYLAELEDLAPIGEVSSDWTIDGQFNHSFDQLSTQEINSDWLMQQAAAFTVTTKIEQSATRRGTDLHFFEAIELAHDITLADQRVRLRSHFSLPHAQLPDLLDINGLNGQLELITPATETPDQIQLSLNIEPAELALHQDSPDPSQAPALLSIGKLATPLSLTLKAHTSDTDFTLEQFDLSSGGEFFTLTAIAQGDLAGNNGQLESTLGVQLDHQLSTNPDYSMQGKIELPLMVNVIDAKQVSVEGDLRFEKLNLTLGPTIVKNLDGQLRIEEELLWDGEAFGFLYLIPSDPFQRVDYSQVQPYLSNHKLKFDSITDADLKMGPGLAGITLKQNLFRLQPFDLKLFGGHVSGQLYLDATPGAWQLGLLSRMTEVDLRQFLPEGSPLRGDELSPISARTALTFDIQKRLMQGRIDITKISRAQVLQMLEVMDPDYQDPQLASVRTALHFAYPERLHISMHAGLMDMQVKVSALPTPITVRNLPLTPLINHFGEESFTELNAMPLK